MTAAADDERRQQAFDEALERIRREGAAAYAAGSGRDDNPYRDHAQPHFRNAWLGGMAEAALGIAFNDGTDPGGPMGP